MMMMMMMMRPASHEKDLRDVLRLLVLPNRGRCLRGKVETPGGAEKSIRMRKKLNHLM